MAEQTQRWVVGLDLRPHSHGAIQFAVWLAEQAGDRVVVEGLHLIDEALLDLPDTGARAQVIGRAKLAAEAALVARKVRSHFAHVDAIATTDVVEALAGAGGLAHTSGVIVGRRALPDERTLIRLGKVARRLLRRLSSPVFVVPPNLERAAIGEGPILVALEPDAAGLALTRYALGLAELLGRPLRLVNVLELGEAVNIEYLPSEAWAAMLQARRAQREQVLQRWREEVEPELAPELPIELVEGEPVMTLLHEARQCDACMILCSSRRLSLVQRIWATSTGSSLAASASVTVGVVPPEADGEGHVDSTPAD